MCSSLIGRTATNAGTRGEVVAVGQTDGRFTLLVLVGDELCEWNPLYVRVEPREDLVKEFFGKERKA
jgi:hypothetical protein